MEAFEEFFLKLEQESEEVFESLNHQFLKYLGVGRANPQILENLRVNYYDSPTPINQLASISVASPLQLVIKPFDTSIIKDIEKVLINSKLPFSVVVDSLVLRINFPQLTAERRKEMIKQLSGFCEQAKVRVRLMRTKLLKDVKTLNLSEDLQKNFQNQLQLKVDKLINKINLFCQKKEEEISKV